MPVQNLIICAPIMEAVHGHLRALDIPPHAFMRRGVRVVTDLSSMERIKGLTNAHWTVVPRHRIGSEMRAVLDATCRGGTVLTWEEAIARSLAWRMYHEC